MKPILFDASETTFTSNGLGRIDALSCTVTEERNGQYELEMEVSIDDEHYSDIVEGRIIYVRHDETQDKQPFDIYYISRPLNGRVTVLAHHVSYRTAKITVEPFEANAISLAFTGIKNKSIGTNPFTFWTDKVVSANFEVTQPKTVRELLAGEQGSILDVYGTGEYEWDKWNIKLHLHRGTDSGVVLRYGKDITELKKTTDTTNIWTGVVPFWYGTPNNDSESESESEDEVLVMLTEKYIMAPNASQFGNDMIVPLDMSGNFDDVPTEAQLRTAAQAYVNSNALSDIPTTIEFSFINLAALEEYQNVAALQRLKLCDTVTIKYDKLGVSNTAKIIETVYDVLQERYISMTVGDVASNLSSTLTGSIKESVDKLRDETRRKINTTRSKLEEKFEETITEQTDLITGGSGGHVVLKRDGEGKPTDILIMDSDSMSTAVQVLRLNVNGIGFSSHGINGPYDSAWTLNGAFNADFISTGELNAGLIKVGVLSDVDGKNYWNMETGEFRLAANTKVGANGTSDTITSLINSKANIFYGTYRTGSTSNFTPNNTEKAVAVGDMRYNSPTTYICTAVSGSTYTWSTFTDALEGDYLVDTYTGKTYKWDGTKWNIATDYKSAIETYDTSLNQQKVFNKLTNNGTVQGIYMQNGNLYVNASYIQSGTLTLGGANNANGTLVIKDASNNTIGQWNKDGINVTSGSINIGNGSFVVNTNGSVTCSDASINGSITSSNRYYDGQGYRTDKIEVNDAKVEFYQDNVHRGVFKRKTLTLDYDNHISEGVILSSESAVGLAFTINDVTNGGLIISQNYTYLKTNNLDLLISGTVRLNGNQLPASGTITNGFSWISIEHGLITGWG